MTREKFPYISLHDAYPEHPKVAALSDAAFRAHVSAICYGHRRQTDGFVPTAVARAWGTKALRELVAVGMLEVLDGGYRIHDYDQWNETKAEIDARRHRNSVAGVKGADSRWHSDRHGEGHDEGNGPPRVDVGVDALALVEVPRAKPPDQVYPADFEAFWCRYPRHVGKRAAFGAWKRALKREDREVIEEAAWNFAADPNLPEEQYIPHAQKWLNRDGWADDPLPARNGHMTETERFLASEGITRG